MRNVTGRFALRFRSIGIPLIQISTRIAIAICALMICAVGACSKISAHNRGSASGEEALIINGRIEKNAMREVSLGEIEVAARSLAVSSPETSAITGELAAELLSQFRDMTLPGTRTVSIPANPDWTKVTDLNFSRAARVLSWSYRNLGDYDLDGTVRVQDITPIAVNYLAAVSEPDTLYDWIDGDKNGEVGVSDVTPIARNYLCEVQGYRIFASESLSDEFEAIGEILFPTGPNAFPVRFEFSVPEDTPRYLSVIPFDSDGLHDTTGMTVDSHNTPPVAALSANPLSGAVPLAVSFDASASYDTDGEIVRYEWDFDGDGQPDADTGDVPYADYLYETKGVFQASVRVFDDLGGLATASVTIAAESAGMPPVAMLNVSPLAGDAPLTVTFDASGSFDPDGEIVQYEWYWRGSTETDPRFDGWWYPVRTFGYPGEYRVVLKVTDGEGLTDTAEALVTVTGENPLYETENNDTPETANPLPLFPFDHGVVTGSIGSDEDFVGYDGDEEDWFSFEVEEQGYFDSYYNLNGVSAGYTLHVLSDTLDIIGISDFGQTGTAGSIKCILPYAGKYYLRMYNYHDNNIKHLTYDISCTFTPQINKWKYDSIVVSSDTFFPQYFPEGLSAVSGNGSLHYAYMLLNQMSMVENAYTIYGTYENDTWYSEIIDDSPKMGNIASIALTSDYLPVVCYGMFYAPIPSLNFRVARLDGTSWVLNEIDTPKPAFYQKLFLELDQNNYAHFVFIDDQYRNLYYVYDTMDGYQVVDLNIRAFNVGGMSINDAGQLQIFFKDYSTENLCFGVYDGNTLNIQVLSNSGLAGNLILDSFGNPHLVYSVPEGEGFALKYSYYDLVWHTEIVADEYCDPLIAIDDQNVPFIAYQDLGGSEHSPTYLRFAEKKGDEWISDIVDIDAHYPNIVLLDGKPAIIYGKAFIEDYRLIITLR